MRISDWSSDVCSSVLESGNAFFEAFEVGEQQFGFDRLGVGDGIDLVLDMLNVVILETAQDMDDRVDFAEVAVTLVAEPSALRRAAQEDGDVESSRATGRGRGMQSGTIWGGWWS